MGGWFCGGSAGIHGFASCGRDGCWCAGGVGAGDEDEELGSKEEGRDVEAEETRLVEYDGGEPEDGQVCAKVGEGSWSSNVSIRVRESTTRREYGTDVSVLSKESDRS